MWSLNAADASCGISMVDPEFFVVVVYTATRQNVCTKLESRP